MESSKDSGWSWIVLLGVCLTALLSMGFTFCIGVFFVDWQLEFEASAQDVGWSSAVTIGAFGISGLVSSVISPYVTCRWQSFSGGVIASIALIFSPWVTHMHHLYIIMSVNGFGLGLSFTNCVLVLSFYFNKKLAVATGIGLSGTVVGMLLLAPLIRYLNDEYSWRGAMLICGGILGNICACSALFRASQSELISMSGIRPNVEEMSTTKTKMDVGNEHESTYKMVIGDKSVSSRDSKPRLSVAHNVRRYSTAFVKSYTKLLSIRSIMFVVLSSVLLGFGYHSSVMYFVSNAIDLGIPKKDASFLLSIFGISGLVGRLSYGPIIDKKIMSAFHLGSSQLAIAGAACFIGSQARSYVALVAFAIVLGFSSSIYIVLYTLMFREVVGNNNYKKMYGIGGIIIDTTALMTIPFMGYLYDITGDYRISFYAAGSAFILNSIIVAMDPVWAKLDTRRLRRPKRDSQDQGKDSVAAAML